jgi:hypothetical protein
LTALTRHGLLPPSPGLSSIEAAGTLASACPGDPVPGGIPVIAGTRPMALWQVIDGFFEPVTLPTRRPRCGPPSLRPWAWPAGSATGTLGLFRPMRAHRRRGVHAAAVR